MALDLLTNLRDHLVAQQLVRVPSAAVPAGAPPLWLEPQDGVPAPGEGNNPVEVGPELVLGAYLTGGIAPRPYESWLRADIVDLWIRSTSPSGTFALEAQLRTALVDRRDWQLAGLHVIESRMWRPLQRLESNAQAFTHIVSFLFDHYA